MREDEAQCLLQPEFRHDRLEVVAVGAQAVQPDDRRLGLGAGLELDRLDAHRMRLNQASDRPAAAIKSAAAAAAKNAVISVWLRCRTNFAVRLS